MQTKRQDRSGTTRLRATALALGLGLVLAACGSEGGVSTGYGSTTGTDRPAASEGADVPAPAAGAVVAVAADAGLGTILTDDRGMTLYLFTSDSPGVSTCVGGCLGAWPALLTDGEPTAQGGADAALLGTLIRDDGTMQVTYGGWPLYYFASDMRAGDVTGQGVGDVWFVVTPDGTAVNTSSSEAGDGDGIGRSPASDGGDSDY